MEKYYPEYENNEWYQETIKIVEKATQTPEDRYALRKNFYKKYGDVHIAGSGLGNSELAFLNWEIKRGVLNSITNKKTGSEWWRSVNTYFIFVSTFASVLYDAKQTCPDIIEVKAWYTYLQDRNATNWYRAHNTSIARGYARYSEKAFSESFYERQFMNMVLYRLLFAGALNEGKEWGHLGEIVANPRLPSVLIMVQIPDFYPSNYPLSKEDIRNVMGKDNSIADLGVRLLDDWIILPQAEELYEFSAELLQVEEIKDWLVNNEPSYAMRANELPSGLSWWQKILKKLYRIFGL